MERRKKKLLTGDSTRAQRETVVVIPKERIDEERELVARELQKKAKIKGFRPGKAPLGIVKNLFGEEIESEARDRLMRKMVLEDIKAQGLEPVGVIRITNERETEEGGLEITASFEVIPDFSLPSISSIKIKRTVHRVTQDEVEREILKLRQSMAEYKRVDEAANEGHVLLIDLEIQDKEGKPLEKKKDLAIKLEWGVTDTNVYEALRGKGSGETAVIERKLALEGGGELEAKYIYKIKSVFLEKLPEINEDFVKKLGFGSVEDFEKSMREKLERESHDRDESRFEKELIEEIYRRIEFELPQSLVEYEIERLKKTVDPKVIASLGPQEEVLKTIAEDFVKRDIILDRAAEELGVEVTEEEIKEEVKKRAKGYKVDPEAYMKRLGEQGLQGIRESVKRKKALEILKNQVQMEVIFE